MSLETKLEFFKLLLRVGFKEIEVGFPAASETEYAFLRALIEQDLIPDDVTIQVLTQAREHIIRRTFEAVKGAKNVIVHVYNSTSVAQREQVFKKSKEEIKQIAVDGAKLLKQLTEEAGEKYRFEYSPESFTGTEPEYALEVVNAVLDIWQPTADRKAVINLPSTVENAMPHVYAQQIEYMHKHMKYRENVVLSNCDIVTLAMNMYSQGVDPGLDFSDMPSIADAYEQFTTLKISPRQPYAGELVFAAFSGSHQDAIAKGMHWRAEHGGVWDVPYLPIDPRDVGRIYDSDVIRINSQSGKGGVGYVLEQCYDIKLPSRMREAMSALAKHVSDEQHKELKPQELFKLFCDQFLSARGRFDVGEVHYKQENGITAIVEVKDGKDVVTVTATGNGRLDAVSNALKQYFGIDYVLTGYESKRTENSSGARARTATSSARRCMRSSRRSTTTLQAAAELPSAISAAPRVPCGAEFYKNFPRPLDRTAVS